MGLRDVAVGYKDAVNGDPRSHLISFGAGMVIQKVFDPIGKIGSAVKNTSLYKAVQEKYVTEKQSDEVRKLSAENVVLENRVLKMQEQILQKQLEETETEENAT